MRDRDDEPSGVPLGRVLRWLVEMEAVQPTDPTHIEGSWGYGCRVALWDERTEGGRVVVVPFGELAALVWAQEEWFNDLRASVPSRGVVFGVHDSHAVFVDGPDDVVRAVVRGFDAVTLGKR